MQEGFGLKVVKLGENGITEKDILIHDAHCPDNTLQLKLALMEGPDFPIALGVIRDVDAPTYNDVIYSPIITPATDICDRGDFYILEVSIF